jgi:hypothetical protein
VSTAIFSPSPISSTFHHFQSLGCILQHISNYARPQHTAKWQTSTFVLTRIHPRDYSPL